MTAPKKPKLAILTGTLGILALMMMPELPPPGIPTFVASAEARVGRPLTPVSVAGVARRSARRCAAGVYNC